MIASKCKVDIEEVKVLLEREFEMKNLGVASKILGMQITRDRVQGVLCVDQRSYVAKVLKTLNMDQSKAVLTPMAQHFKFSHQHSPQTKEEATYMKKVPYANAVGSIMYLMICPRPNLAYAMSLVSRYMGKSRKVHWEALKWIFRYRKGMCKAELLYAKHESSMDDVVGFVDSNYVGCLDTKRLLIGYMFKFCCNTVSWKGNLQHVVSLSINEAEFIALAEAIKEAVWMKGMAMSVHTKVKDAKVYYDSQSGIHLAKNQTYHERTKHIDVKLHFVREVIANGEVVVAKIHTEDNPMGTLIKALPRPKFKHCVQIMKVEGA